MVVAARQLRSVPCLRARQGGFETDAIAAVPQDDRTVPHRPVRKFSRQAARCVGQCRLQSQHVGVRVAVRIEDICVRLAEIVQQVAEVVTGCAFTDPAPADKHQARQ